MEFITIIGIAVFLSLDSFSIAITTGSVDRAPTSKRWYLTSLLFAGVQMLMSLLGIYIGKTYTDAILWLYHIAAFLIFILVGLKLLCDFFLKKDNNTVEMLMFSPKSAIILAIATSLDAFATGMRFYSTECSIGVFSAIVLVFTFIMMLFGFHIGSRVKNILNSEARVFAALLLIAVSVKILLDAFFM